MFVTGASIYEVVLPTAWARPPETYSFSSLATIRECPRRWLLTNSRWGEFATFPQRPKPSAIEAQIVHEALDRLAKELGRVGRPSIDSPAFSSAVVRCEFWAYFGEQLAEWNARLARHPRAGSSYVLRAKAADLANLAVRLFREQYRTGHGKAVLPMFPAIEARASVKSVLCYVKLLEERGHLSELFLKHPLLPLIGVLDLVQRGEGDRIAIIDFKTGAPRPDHKEQLETYAVLWWRVTGQFPTHIAVQYLESNREWRISPEEIQSREEILAEEIRQSQALLQKPPAPAQPGEACRWCPVRARCDEGWSFYEQAANQSSPMNSSIDAELVVTSPRGSTGFLAKRLNNREVKIVYEPATGAGLPLIVVGDRIRLIDALAQPGGNEIKLLPWTETYRISFRSANSPEDTSC